MKILKKLLLVSLILIFCVSASNAQEYGNTVKKKFMYKADYITLENKINDSLKSMPSLGYLWRVKGILYLFDYKFKDGEEKANLSRAIKCFNQGVVNNDPGSYYLLAVAYKKKGNYKKSLSILENRITDIKKFWKNSKTIKLEYTQLSNMYAGIVLDKNLDINYIHKAITYEYELAYSYMNNLAQLQVGLLYAKIGKNNAKNYFISQACLRENGENTFVKNFCKKNITINKTECKECKMKKKLHL